MWYDPDESNRLFREVLAPLEPYLRQINFRGDFDVNCVVNENGAFPLEATSRFGYPAVQLQSVLHRSSWTQLLCAVARGESFDLEWQEGFGIVILIALPPFPFFNCVDQKRPSIRGLKIHFRDEPDAEDQRHIHWEEVTVHKDKDGRHHYYSCSESGYLMHVSGVGETVEVARKDVYRRAGNIVIPKMFYRNDIGLNFIENDRERLVEWGYL
jgi:phosphoribosylamine--glycine ligase